MKNLKVKVEDLGKLKEDVKILKVKVEDLEKLKEDMKNLRAKVDELEKLLKAINTKLQAMEALSGKSSEGGISLSGLDGLISSLKSELYATLVNKEDFAKLVKRVEELEALTQELRKGQEHLKAEIDGVSKITMENTDEINKLKERIKVLEAKLNDKVNCEDYDKLLLLINQL